MTVARVTAAGLIVCWLAVGAEQVGFGSIEITSKPGGAAVYVEGFLVGHTPTLVPQLTPDVSYRLVLKMEAYDDFVQDVAVAEGRISKVSAEMQPGAKRFLVRREDDWQPQLRGQRRPAQPRKRPGILEPYTTLEIANFLHRSDKKVKHHHLYALLPELARRLDVKTTFARYTSRYTAARPSARWVAQEQEPGGKTLVLSGVITHYRPGNRILRNTGMLGMAIGMPTIRGEDTQLYCLFRVADEATGEILVERLVKGKARSIYHSSKAVKNLASNIAEAIAASR